jgi:galactose mutarotase-like enzyme
MMADQHRFGTGDATACVLAQGAELCSLQTPDGTEFIWNAGPAWPRHAPILFPIVGRLVGDTLRHDGHAYRMTQHGFARDRRFTWVEQTATGCILALQDDVDTRAMYPFAFRFEVQFTLIGATLTVTLRTINTGTAPLPASMGAHPAFRWPLDPGLPKEAYALTFAASEPGPIRTVSAGLLTKQHLPTPVRGQTLPLTETLFANDALIWEHPNSRSVRFAAATGPALTVAWEHFPQLGIWMKPGADFLCIEPWAGLASPASFDDEFTDKPWTFALQPGATRDASYSMTVEPAT